MPMAKTTPRKTYKKKAIYKKKYRKPSKAFVKNVQKIIAKKAENKSAVLQIDNTSFNSAINSSGDVYNLMPSLPQGSDNAQRVGNQVNAKYLDIKGHFQLNAVPTALTIGIQAAGTILLNCRIAIRLMIVTSKIFKNPAYAIANAAGGWLPYLLDNGLNDKTFDGNVKDLYLPINRDAVVVHYDKVLYVNIPMQYQVVSGSTVAPLTGSVRFFRKRINMKKILKYTDLSNEPQNAAPVLLCGYAHIDGSTPDTLTTACNVSFVSTLSYEDV